MKLLVGLGNPGAKYEKNRHNVGFMAIDAIADAHGLPAWRKKFQGLVTEGTIGGQRVLLLKPQTYMNESGRSVGEAMRFHKLGEGDVTVFYDEIDLAAGKLKVKTGGGNAGHNGLRSMTAHIGNDYTRVRIGVGHPGEKHLVANYVLSDFAKAEQEWLAAMLEEIATAAPLIAKGDSARFLSEVTRRLTDRGGDAPAPAGGTLPRARRVAEGAEAAGSGSGRDAGGRAGAGGRPARAGGGGRHPAGERASKRQNALAENLRKWLAGRGGGSEDGSER